MKKDTTQKQDFNLDDKESFKLIDGTFDTVEANDVLLTILNDKIRFHNIQILGIQERCDGDAVISERRLSELKEVKKQVVEFISKAQNNNCDIKINAAITMELKNKG